MLKRYLALISMILFLFANVAMSQIETTAMGSYNYPANIHYSFAQGIIHNPVMTDDTVKSFAAEVIARTYPPKEQATYLKKLEKMTREEMMEFAIQVFPIDYVEVSESELNARGRLLSDLSKVHAAEAGDSPLRFMKNGEVYYRWFIHPLRKDLDFLQKLGSPTIQRGRFLAQFTESRSMPVFDTTNNQVWSIKLSLPQGMNSMGRKPLRAGGAKQQFDLSEVIQDLEKKGELKARTYFPEIHAVGFISEGIDEAMLVRSLSLIKPHQIFISYVAIFIAGLERYLPKSMKKRRMSIEIEKLAIAAAEKNALMTAKTGFIQNSNHSQNGGLLIDSQTETIDPISRDPDVYFDGFNKKVAANAKYLPAGSWQIDAVIDFKMRDAFKEAPLNYSIAEYNQIYSKYVETFQKTFLRTMGYAGLIPSVSASDLWQGLSFASMHELIQNEGSESRKSGISCRSLFR